MFCAWCSPPARRVAGIAVASRVGHVASAHRDVRAGTRGPASRVPAHAALRQLVTAPGSSMASSLSRELAADRPPEVENLLGDLIHRGRAAGVHVSRLEAAALTLRAHNRRPTATRGN
ncbi:ketopantoate reductase C-terminal domain-containing protein [Streptomyces sp. SID1121]|uniref:ketopantoate reductase C-terminal domain-containing protein n=1 Tax=Streptomyces sp. SID1121 TaxID=3425888 RepID=UPI004055F8A3